MTIGEVDAVCSKDTPKSTLMLADTSSLNKGELASALSKAINAELEKAGIPLRIPNNCAGPAASTCNIRDVKISQDGEITFTTHAGAGKNAGGLNDALRRAVESGLSISGVDVEKETSQLTPCSDKDKELAGRYTWTCNKTNSHAQDAYSTCVRLVVGMREACVRHALGMR